jgi:RNA polymerase sigma factor (sigma-70 family)
VNGATRETEAVVNDDRKDRGAPEAGESLVGRDPPRLRVVGDDVYPDWDAIYLDNVARVHRVMYSKVGNRPDAEDLTAEVFVAAFGPLRVSASRGEVRGYLLATARTVLAGYWRRRLGVEVTSIDPDAEQRGWDEPDGPNPAPERARRVLDALPDRYRRILELRFLQAMSLKEAAKEMDVTVGNAKVLQHRALRLAAQGPGGWS